MKGSERLQNALSFSEEGGVPFDLGATTVSSIAKRAYTRSMEFRDLPPLYGEMNEFDPVQQIVQPLEENLEYLGGRYLEERSSPPLIRAACRIARGPRSVGGAGPVRLRLGFP